MAWGRGRPGQGAARPPRAPRVMLYVRLSLTQKVRVEPILARVVQMLVEVDERVLYACGRHVQRRGRAAGEALQWHSAHHALDSAPAPRALPQAQSGWVSARCWERTRAVDCPPWDASLPRRAATRRTYSVELKKGTCLASKAGSATHQQHRCVLALGADLVRNRLAKRAEFHVIAQLVGLVVAHDLHRLPLAVPVSLRMGFCDADSAWKVGTDESCARVPA